MRRRGLRSRAPWRFAALAVVGLLTLLAVTRTNADPSFGLLGGRDILRPGLNQPSSALPYPAPSVALSGDALGLPGGASLDAISYGNDDPNGTSTFVVFSVDNLSAGYPLATFDVYAEALGIDGAAGADLFTSTALPVSGPSCDAQPSRLLIDGDGMLGGATGNARAEAPGIGLDETPGGPPGTAGRDDLATLDLSGWHVVDDSPAGGDGTPDHPLFFSVPAGSAASLGFASPSGADIYLYLSATGVVRFATASALGLAVEDEVDALAVYHPGTGSAIAAADAVVFSLAPGSPSLANLATQCHGTAATAADLWLVSDLTLSAYADAEQLGLCAARSYSLCNPYSASGDDNVDALDLVAASGTDTDGDGLDDAVDPDDDGDGQGDPADACPGDADGDCVYGANDGCPNDYNPNQLNTDSGPANGTPPRPGDVGTIDNGPGVANVDDTVASGDAFQDACDGDRDNDGLLDVDEDPLANCGAFNGFAAGHPHPAFGDNTNDDNGNGNPTAPMGTDASDNGASWDTDGDGSLDGYECAQGTNPRSSVSKPSSATTPDTDGDGLPDNWELRGIGTNPNATDSDGDGIGDCKEHADIDGNGVVNSTGDLVALANVLFSGAGATLDFDLDRNGTVNSTGELVTWMSPWVNGTKPCL